MPFSCDLIHCTEGKLDCYNEFAGHFKDQIRTRQNPSGAGEWSPATIYKLGWNHSGKMGSGLNGNIG